MTKPENPPAFPTDGRIQHGTAYDGMTLRDYFAGQIASAYCTATDSTGSWTTYVDKGGARTIAERAYAVADAMLAERNRSHDQD